MIDRGSATPVTRQEFYGALVVVWLYIMLVIGDLLRIEWRWTTAILWAAALGMMVLYSVVSFASRSRGGRAGRTSAPLSDRVKDIARDPSRKIEAIQAHREETGAGLAETKDAVEAYINGL